MEAREADDVAVARLEGQIAWYDAQSTYHKRWFKRLKVTQLTAVAAVLVLAALDLTGWPTAFVGALLMVLEGLQQLNQHQQNWMSYRSTCEALEHEKYLFRAMAGPYATAAQPARLLAERTEGLVSQEHADWTERREEAADELQEVSSLS